MRKVFVAQSGFCERLARQTAGCVIENIDADQDDKTCANKHETARGGDEADVTQGVKQANVH
jgi:hypothetical protein